MKYAILIYKATRGAVLLSSGLDAQVAREQADQSYKTLKALSANWLSGMAAIVVADEDAQAVCVEGIRANDQRVVYQCGPY